MPRTSSTSSRHTSALAPERGIGLVEVIVVLLLIAIIGTIALASLHGTKRNAATTQGRTVARTLGEGIEQFARDRGGRVPGAPGGADWANGWRSPVDVANGNAPYVKATALEPLDSGTVALVAQSGRIAPGGDTAPARLQYRTDASSRFYAIVVSERNGTTYRPACYVSNATSDGGSAFLGTLGVTATC